MLELHLEAVVPALFHRNRPVVFAFFQIHILRLIRTQAQNPFRRAQKGGKECHLRGKADDAGGIGYYLAYGDIAYKCLYAGKKIDDQRGQV